MASLVNRCRDMIAKMTDFFGDVHLLDMIMMIILAEMVCGNNMIHLPGKS